jgi:hypothetical protein
MRRTEGYRWDRDFDRWYDEFGDRVSIERMRSRFSEEQLKQIRDATPPRKPVDPYARPRTVRVRDERVRVLPVKGDAA